MTVEAPTMEVIKQVFNCGADDLLVKPLSPKQLMLRIEALARGRKPFVVTHDYIGPDRRKAERPGEGEPTPLIDVPNALRSKAAGNMDQSSLQLLIDKVASEVNEHKMERHSVQIDWLVARISPALAKGDGSDLSANLSRLQYVAEDLSRRLRGTRFSHVAELAMSLVGLVTRIRDARTHPDPTDIELLPKLSLAIKRSFDSAAGVAAVAREISETIGIGDTKASVTR